MNPRILSVFLLALVSAAPAQKLTVPQQVEDLQDEVRHLKDEVAELKKEVARLTAMFPVAPMADAVKAAIAQGKFAVGMTRQQVQATFEANLPRGPGGMWPTKRQIKSGDKVVSIEEITIQSQTFAGTVVLEDGKVIEVHETPAR